jgi:hypothetical protein
VGARRIDQLGQRGWRVAVSAQALTTDLDFNDLERRTGLGQAFDHGRCGHCGDAHFGVSSFIIGSNQKPFSRA